MFDIKKTSITSYDQKDGITATNVFGVHKKAKIIVSGSGMALILFLLLKSNTVPNINFNFSHMFNKEEVQVVSHNQQGGITAHTVNFAKPPRKLDEAVKHQILQTIPKESMVDVTAIMGDQEAFQFASEIFQFIKTNGYKHAGGVSQAVFNQPVIGQILEKDSDTWKIVIGSAK